MTSMEFAGYGILGVSAVFTAIALWVGRGRAISLVFLYLLAYQGMELALKWEKINYFNDISYISLALAIDMFWFYFFYHRSLYFLALIIGFDVIYSGANLYLLGSGIGALDVIYGHIGIAVSILLIIGGVSRGIGTGHDSDTDSWGINWARIVRALSLGKRAEG